MTTHAFLLLSHDKAWPLRLVGLFLGLFLLLEGCSIVRRSSNEPPPLIKAVSKGDMPTTRALLTKGADVQARDANGRTALMYAAENGDPTTVQALLTYGADVNAHDGQGWTALIYAAENGDFTTVQTLLAHKAHVNAKSEGSGWTALMSAAARGHLLATQALLANGAEANARDKEDQTALHMAVQQGYTAIVQALLDGGADVNMKNKKGETPLTVAEAQGFSKIAQLLKQAGTRGQIVDTPPATKGTPPAASPTTARAPQPVTPRTPPTPPAEKLALHFGRYHALVIGNNAYTDMSPLKTAVNDATAVAELLQTMYGFTVTLLTNTTRDEIITALDQLRATLTGQDNLLIYYAGHGVLDASEERGYWLPINAKQDSRIQWISNTTITDALKAMAAKHILVVADSCYSGTLVRGIDVVHPPSGSERDTYVARIAQKRSRTVLTSGGLEPVSDSGGGKEHSVFAKAFLTALQENRDVLEGQQLFNLVRRPVILNAAQTPEYTDIRYAGHEGGDFLFVRQAPPSPQEQPVGSSPPLPDDTPAPASPTGKSMENAQQSI
jgi:caspase domain-containing protein/ankyrin repeat protein